MKKKGTTRSTINRTSLKTKIHDFFYGILLTPLFRSIGNVFSHGLTHFIALFLTGLLTGWLYYKNSTIDIIPHNIAFDIHWTNTHYLLLPNGVEIKTDSIRNLEVQLELNSKDAIKETDGKFQNRLVFQFDGTSHPVVATFHLAGQGKEDSIQINLFSDPVLSDFRIVMDSAKFIFDESEQKQVSEWKSFNDGQNEVFRREVTIPFHPISDQDTTLYLSYRQNGDSLLTIKLIPSKHEVGGKIKSPRQKVMVYSNSFGVDDKNPYYYYFLALPSTKIAGSLKFEFIASDLTHPQNFDFSFSQDKNLQYNYVFPVPDIINNGYIEYHTSQKIEEIKKNRGVIIQAVDVESLNKLNNLSFLYSVLVGTGLAFLLDIFIQLIRELRNVNIRYGKHKEGTSSQS